MTIIKNPAQEEAISTINGPLLLISCPGSGKTTTLVRRIHHMIESGIVPDRILMVTFTRDAALSMKEKYISMYGSSPGATFATIHALCLQILLNETSHTKRDIIREDQQMSFLVDRLHAKRIWKDAWEMAVAAATAISGAKNNYLKPETMDVQGLSKDLFVELYYAYEGWKEDNQYISI